MATVEYIGWRSDKQAARFDVSGSAGKVMPPYVMALAIERMLSAVEDGEACIDCGAPHLAGERSCRCDRLCAECGESLVPGEDVALSVEDIPADFGVRPLPEWLTNWGPTWTAAKVEPYTVEMPSGTYPMHDLSADELERRGWGDASGPWDGCPDDVVWRKHVTTCGHCGLSWDGLRHGTHGPRCAFEQFHR